MTNAQNLAGAPASGNNTLRALGCHGQRLLAKEILTRRDHLEGLLLVECVRRGKHDSFNPPDPRARRPNCGTA